MKIIIIGAGLFGSVARDLLVSLGCDTLVIDNDEDRAGSKAAGCLIKPSWLTKLPKPSMDGGLATLDRLYGLRRMTLRSAGVPLGTILHAPPSRILRGPDLKARVDRIDHENGVVVTEDGFDYMADAVLVAAGIWSTRLLPDNFFKTPLQGLMGTSLWFKESTIRDASMKVWAPYKQSIAFDIDPGERVWFGDGTAIKPENWSHQHFFRAIDHASQLDERLVHDKLIGQTKGIRPYLKGHTGAFARVGAKSWVSTGGAKNGVVLAAVQALEFARALKLR